MQEEFCVEIKHEKDAPTEKTLQFIKKAEMLHKDTSGNPVYHYSKSAYLNARAKLIITCKLHGDFLQSPDNHLRSHGCVKCSGIKNGNKCRMTTEEFVQRAKLVHIDSSGNSIYDYSKTIYGKKSGEKVAITCKTHGEFRQTPNSHLAGQGCDKCGGSASYTTEEFIERAKQVQIDSSGNPIYDYSKTIYGKNSKEPVIIICKTHDEFLQLPGSHLQGRGCTECGIIKMKNKQRYTTEEFVEKVKKLHVDSSGNPAYDYSKTIYGENSTEPVIIICKIHGDFEQTPASHLSGCGCSKCGVIKRSDNCRMTTEEFIEKAKQVHIDSSGNPIYDYSKTIYGQNAVDPVIIICKIHGDFEQTPNGHLSGCGCSKCALIKRSDARRTTTQEFVERAQQIHVDNSGFPIYDYSNTTFGQNSTEKISIICKIHGEFKQVPGSHLQGMGCAKCGRKTAADMHRTTTEDFIDQAEQIHCDVSGNPIYDYSNTKYGQNATETISIICKIHGEFKQLPGSHLQGSGCAKCGRTKANHALRMPIHEFIERAKQVHTDASENPIYDYCKTDYGEYTSDKVIITCKKHGDFEQTPHNHLTGRKCKGCAKTNYSQSAIAYLKYISEINNIKIKHAENGGEFIIQGIGKADGYCEETNTIYEFHGDFWHGNPDLYDDDEVNNVNGKSFKLLYENTLKREQNIKDLGFNLIVMWENDWNLFKKTIVKIGV